jgi:sulfatase modifying factor 1
MRRSEPSYGSRISTVGLACLAMLIPCGVTSFVEGAGNGKAARPTGKDFTNSLGMRLVRIEPGSFVMGTSGELPMETLAAAEIGISGKNWLPKAGDYDERPAHKVTIHKAFYMGVVEVTNQQFETFDPLHQYLRGKHGFSIDHDEAVVFVDWHQAKAFCDWLSKKEGLPYRLPTEAEWEYACRAGTTTPYSTGTTLPAECIKNPDSSWYPVAQRSRGRQEVVPLHVGRTKPNPWGLCDMHGNVEEWCHDWYGPYEAQDQVDPVGRIDGDFRVTRGGSHGTIPFYLRSANRLGTIPEDKHWQIGFRVVLGELPTTKQLPRTPPALFQQEVEQKTPANVLEAADAAKPYFRGPRPYVKIAPDAEGPLFAKHNHDPGIAECPNGDLLAIWYTTVTERGREISMAASRLRYGTENWQPASVFWDAPDRNDHAPALWFDGAKTLYHFHGLSSAATWGPLAIVMRTSNDSGATWSKARLIAPEHVARHQVVESVFRTKEGYLILPCDAAPGSSGGTAIHLSRDQGKTWTDPGGTIRGIHAGVAQLNDGRLIAFGRGEPIDGAMPMSISADLGKTWTYHASMFPPIGGGQRLVLRRLKEGLLLLISFAPPVNATSGKSFMITDASGKKRPIQGLFAAVSHDDGKTWPHIRSITDDGPAREIETTDGRTCTLSSSSGEPRGYMAGCQGRNGVFHLISSRQHYSFNLAWLRTAAPRK